MLNIKLEKDFFQNAIKKIGTPDSFFSKEKDQLYFLVDLCKYISKQKYSLHFSNEYPTEEELENDPFIRILIDNNNSNSRNSEMVPDPNYFTQLGLVNSDAQRVEWIKMGNECISLDSIAADIDKLSYEFDYDFTIGTPYDVLTTALKPISINFNTLIIIDKYIAAKDKKREILDDFLNAVFSNNKCETEIEVVILTDLNGRDTKLIYNELSLCFNKYKNITLKLFDLSADRSIHDRRIWTNDRQIYSGFGFSGSESGGIIKIESDRIRGTKRTLNKDSKVQFKYQLLSDRGILDLESQLNNIKKIILKAENRPASEYLKEHLSYYPDKKLCFLERTI